MVPLLRAVRTGRPWRYRWKGRQGSKWFEWGMAKLGVLRGLWFCKWWFGGMKYTVSMHQCSDWLPESKCFSSGSLKSVAWDRIRSLKSVQQAKCSYSVEQSKALCQFRQDPNFGHSFRALPSSSRSVHPRLHPFIAGSCLVTSPGSASASGFQILETWHPSISPVYRIFLRLFDHLCFRLHFSLLGCGWKQHSHFSILYLAMENVSLLLCHTFPCLFPSSCIAGCGRVGRL